MVHRICYRLQLEEDEELLAELLYRDEFMYNDEEEDKLEYEDEESYN